MLWAPPDQPQGLQDTVHWGGKQSSPSKREQQWGAGQRRRTGGKQGAVPCSMSTQLLPVLPAAGSEGPPWASCRSLRGAEARAEPGAGGVQL